MDIEADEQLGRVYSAMDAKTRDFLAKFKSNLDRLFSKELSAVYLDKMSDHLETFYDDVNDELDTKHINMAKKVDDLLEEARNLKRLLRDTAFNLFMNDNNELSLMDYKDKLEEDMAELRELYEKKKNVIDECLLEQKQLCEELGEEPRELTTDPLATEVEISEFRTYLVELQHEKLRRVHEVSCLQQQIEELCNEMEFTVSETARATIKPTLEDITRLKAEVAYYDKQRESIKMECDHLIDKLESLWDCLECPPFIREQYRDMGRKYTQKSIEQLKHEFKKCKETRQENIKEVILKMRERIVHQWDKIYRSEQERLKFQEYFESTLYNDDLLTLHEMEYEECKRFFDENKKIFELYYERSHWFEKKKALDAKQNDRNRFNNRGGQLLKEEKERKMMEAKIPKIENEIKSLALEFREQNKHDFLINGESIIDVMEKEWENYRGSKLLNSARKPAATPSRNGAAPKTPVSMRGNVTLKRVASNSNLGMSTGNLAKKRHLELPSSQHAKTSVKIVNTTSTHVHKANIKRNLLSQMENTAVEHGFAKPKTASKLQPKSQKSIANISAGKIIRKYRRSSRPHISNITGTEESLINYDAFETKMKSSEINNSSIVEQQENNHVFGMTKMSSMIRSGFKTPTKLNNNTNRTPFKSNFTRLQTRNLDDYV